MSNDQGRLETTLERIDAALERRVGTYQPKPEEMGLASADAFIWDADSAALVAAPQVAALPPHPLTAIAGPPDTPRQHTRRPPQ